MAAIRTREALAVSRAIAVVLPWTGGLLAGREATGMAASFGAYVFVVAFPSLPAERRATVLTAALAIFGLVVGVGAGVRLGSPVFFVAALAVALAQGATELRSPALRLPVGLAALVFFLSVGKPPSEPTLAYVAHFVAGCLWGFATVVALAPRAAAAAKPQPRAPRRRSAARYLGCLVSAAVAASVGASILGGPHACWLPTATMRMMKPLRRDTLYRVRARGTGSLLGAVAASVLLGIGLPPHLYPVVIGGMVATMLFYGAKEYGRYSFCLTIVALTFGSAPDTRIAMTALVRVGLTLGAILVVLAATVAWYGRGDDRATAA